MLILQTALQRLDPVGDAWQAHADCYEAADGHASRRWSR